MNKQLIRRPKQQVSSKSVGVAALSAIIANKGEDWVLQQVQNGAMFLSNQARAWWASRVTTAPSSAMVANAAPTSVGVAVRGSSKLQGDTRIRHRELVASSVANGTTRFRINPVDQSAFPYLSTLANMYDEYKFHSFRIVVVSATPTTTGDRWYLAWDPDSEDPAPNGAQEFMAMRNSLSMTAWQSGELTLPGSKRLYCAYFANTLKDHGAFYFSKNSGSFDVYVEYDVSLYNPNVVSPIETLKNSTLSLLQVGTLTETYGPEFIRAASPPTAGSFELPPGNWIINLRVTGAPVLGAVTVQSFTGDTVTVGQRNISVTAAAWQTIVVQSVGMMRVNMPVTGTLTSDRCYLNVSPMSQIQFGTMLDALG